MSEMKLRMEIARGLVGLRSKILDAEQLDYDQDAIIDIYKTFAEELEDVIRV